MKTPESVAILQAEHAEADKAEAEDIKHYKARKPQDWVWPEDKENV